MVLRNASIILALALTASACGDSGDSAADVPGPTTDGEPAVTASSPPPETGGAPTTKPDGDGQPSNTLTTIPAGPETSKPSIVTGPTVPMSIPDDPTIARLVTLAVADLSERLGVDAEHVALVGFDQVTWSDGSLGCPQPGMSYTQALVDGTRIRLLASDVVFEYHSGGTTDPFYCPDPAGPSTGGSAGHGDT